MSDEFTYPSLGMSDGTGRSSDRVMVQKHCKSSIQHTL